MPTPGRVMTSTPHEAGNDRQPAPPPRPFAEQRPGKRGDHHRREEEDRGRLGELQRLQRQEVEDGGAEQEYAAQHLRRQIDEPEHRRVAPAPEQHQHDDDVAGEAHPGDERRRHARQHQIFGAGVEEGKQYAGGDHQEDRRQRSRLFVDVSGRGHWKSLGRVARLVVPCGAHRNPANGRSAENPAKRDYSSASTSSSISAKPASERLASMRDSSLASASAPSCRGP